ncbi:MAG: DUF4398 domain-containing protein [Methyloprofundus sp.]|nr:DUF4398 domain-containing protein [Methyloprofundus sp.]MBW6454184.1 DUF4398 domain-containing protein [Methyloprofundus sp.]
MFTKKSIATLLKATALGAIISALTACGIAPPKTEIAYAEAALQSARNADLEGIAGVQLERAASKLQQAKAEMQDGDNAKALRLANEAIADANLAQAKAQAGIARSSESDMQKSLEMLKTQLK